jgi:hypothetical protein
MDEGLVCAMGAGSRQRPGYAGDVDPQVATDRILNASAGPTSGSKFGDLGAIGISG